MTASNDRTLTRVLISGGAGGVGLACAEALAQHDVELIVCDIDGIALTRAAEHLQAFARFCDSIEDNSVAIFADEIREKFGTIDVLINAAGRGYIRALAMVRMTRAFMPLLRRATGQRLLVNIAPAGGFMSSDGMFPYASSQAAFLALSEAMAEQTRGASIKIANVTPRLLHARDGEAPAAPQSYQLCRVDEQYAAEQVLSLIETARGINARAAPPRRGSTSGGG